MAVFPVRRLFCLTLREKVSSILHLSLMVPLILVAG